MEEAHNCGSKRRRLNDEPLPFQPCPVSEALGLQEQNDVEWRTMKNRDHNLYADCIPLTDIETVCFGMVSAQEYIK
jgi:hypothetical protein